MTLFMRPHLSYLQYIVLSVLAIAVFAIALLQVSYIRIRAQYLFEDVSFVLRPSADYAMTIAENHFDARSSGEYDVTRAKLYFQKAMAIDPRTPYLNHELARIAFLRGDFNDAMWHIDKQIQLFGDTEPNSYYIRGLIEGYQGNYAAAVKDYEHFIIFDPNDWAAINDYCWVLLKANRAHDALLASARGLSLFPDNPWLLNTNAIALYETGLKEPAKDQAKKALAAVEHVTEAEWLHSYPGNDPRIGAEGLATFKSSVHENAQAILADSGVPSDGAKAK